MPLMDYSLLYVLQDAGRRAACLPERRLRYAYDIFAGVACFWPQLK